MAFSSAYFFKNNAELLNSNKRLVLAYSGGLDSSVLLYLLVKNVDPKRLLIWHVNHQLQPFAKEMEAFCQQQTHCYKIPFKLTRLDLSHLTGNIESQARVARYTAFANELSSSNDVLLTAHHADDQFETLILNMCRGTGINGLRGIADQIDMINIPCRRPLLNIIQDDLIVFAKENKIEWIDDPSNAKDYFDRNYVRHEITPAFKKRWPAVVKSFTQVAAHQKEAAQCLEELALIDFKRCEMASKYSKRKTLSISSIKKQSIPRQRNLLRYWLSIYSVTLSLKQFDFLVDLILVNEGEFKKIEFGKHSIALFKGEMFLFLEQDKVDNDAVLKWLASQTDEYVCRLNSHTKNMSNHFLKRQFQSANIPPWLRDQTLFKINKDGSKHNLEIVVL